MILLLQAAPLLVLVGLLVSGRAGPVPAVCAALAAALPAALASLPGDAAALPFLAEQALRGAYLALKPIAVVAGGLLLHAAVSRDRPPASGAPEPRRIFVACILLGGFLECVTGFGVGAVFAVAALRGMGLPSVPAGALALLSNFLVPWGGLGPGTALAAALTGIPGQALAMATAFPAAAWILLLGPVVWRCCAAAGIAVPGREKAAQTALLTVVAALLLLSHLLFPFEVAGILATGLPLLFALWRLDPPRGAEGWRRAGAAMAPFAGLTLAILAARAIPQPAEWRPFPDLPGFAATHVAVVLWIYALALLACRGGFAARAKAALARARRPATAMLLYVVLARWMAGSGAAASLAQAASGALGPLAPYAIPPLAVASGMVTGSNVASNAALGPIQQALGRASGLPEMLAPALHNFGGSAGAGMSFAVAAMVCGLLGDGTRPPQLWRLVWPALLGAVVVGWVAVMAWP
jgi:lactate permease